MASEDSNVPEAEPQPIKYELVVTVSEAHNLQNKDEAKGLTNYFKSKPTNLSDPFAIIKCGSFRQKTSTIRDSLDPVWNFEMRFPIYKLDEVPQTLYLECFDEDPNDNEFLGCACIPLPEAIQEMKGPYEQGGWYNLVELGDPSLEPPPVRRKRRPAPVVARGPTLSRAKAIVDEDESETPLPMKLPDQTPDKDAPLGNVRLVLKLDPALPEPEPDPLEEAAEELGEDQTPYGKKFMVDRESLGKAPLGDYTVRVNILEVNNLVGKDSSGTSDPFVRVVCNGDVKQTETLKATSSGIYNELFTFNIEVANLSDLEVGKVFVQVLDANRLFSNEPIGSFEVELGGVYATPKHELWRQWFALTNSFGKGEGGVQGFLKASFVVLGPEDEQQVHDEDQEEKADRLAAAAGVHNVYCMNPDVDVKQYALQLNVDRAEGLPEMDSATMNAVGKAADAFVAVCFGNPTEVVTEVVNSQSPKWNERLVLPATLPSLSNTIRVRVMDFDSISQHDLIGQLTLRFDDVLAGEYKDARWWNLYGPSENTSSDMATAMVCGKVPGSAWRGRVLMSMSVTEMKKPKRSSKGEFIHQLPLELPMETAYSVQMELYNAFGVPTTSSEVTAKVSFGSVEASFSPRPVHMQSFKQAGANIMFLESIMTKPTFLPDDITQVPDVFVEIWDNGSSPITGKRVVCWGRFSPESLTGEIQWMKFNAGPGATSSGVPVWVNLRATLFVGDDAEATEGAFPEGGGLPLALPSFRNYLFRYAVYQAQHLPSTSNEEFADPYCVLTGSSPVTLTQFKSKASSPWPPRSAHPSLQRFTTFPSWYASNMTPISLPADLNALPPVSVLVLDRNELCSDVLLGSTSMTGKAMVEEGMRWLRSHPNTPIPHKWHCLELGVDTGLKPCNKPAQLLASFELFPADEVTGLYPVPRPLTLPPTMLCLLELTVIGLRGPLKPYCGLSISKPSVRITIGSMSDPLRVAETKPSDEPTGQSPNFFQVLSMSIPVHTLSAFAPTLRCDVLDHRLTGAVCVGTAFVPLSAYLPWEVAARELAESSGGEEEEEEEEEEVINLEPETTVYDISGTADDENEEAASSSAKKRRRRKKKNYGSMASQEREISEPLLSSTTGEVVLDMPPHQEAAQGTELATARGAADADDSEGANDSAKQTEKLMEQMDTWRVGRKVYNDALEKHMDLEPFGKFAVLRHQESVGYLKGTIKMTVLDDSAVKAAQAKAEEETPAPAEIPKASAEEAAIARTLHAAQSAEMRRLMMPNAYVARLYVIRTRNIVAPGKVTLGPKHNGLHCYLKVKIGGQTLSFRDDLVYDSLQPQFRKCIELPVMLPGVSVVQIEVWHHDSLYRDVLVGQTELDLENRLFSKEWRESGASMLAARRVPGRRDGGQRAARAVWQGPEGSEGGRAQGVSEGGADRPQEAPLPPIERRTLTKPGSNRIRGKLEMWMELWPEPQAKINPPIDIHPPPPAHFEARLIIWRTRKVPNQDPITNQSDLFIRSTLTMMKSTTVGGADRLVEDTDTHWRAKKGEASFNYRMIYAAELPVAQARLKLQAWDQDLLNSNDYIGEALLDLSGLFRTAFVKHRAPLLSVSPPSRFTIASRRACLEPSRAHSTIARLPAAVKWLLSREPLDASASRIQTPALQGHQLSLLLQDSNPCSGRSECNSSCRVRSDLVSWQSSLQALNHSAALRHETTPPRSDMKPLRRAPT
ncbi:hypothetical protein CYMTET_54488 [Cymbomonas tetramitiformis]|uniref:C2 domain-containing protein n=1 Tax=Cymbomonas tetramitiformis TaxID=36881 RepID=A0AAE0ENN5_9CHLO|nr:hypothetical protein CYMTET_54488 [Cymbomonas tetramitiformis]